MGVVCRGPHTKSVWAWMRQSGGGEEMYMNGAPRFLERKLTVRLGFEVRGGGCESGSGLSSSVNECCRVSGSQARRLGKGLQCES